VKLGLIARADSRGLGVQTKAVFDNLHPVKTMVVDCPSAKPLPLRRDWYPGATWINGLPTAQDFRAWLHGLDCVYTAETGYSRALWDEAERAGVRTVLAANYEFLDRFDRPTVWAMPSMWHYDDVPFGNKTFLPVPIDTQETLHISGTWKETAQNFVHVVGRPAIHDRNGTADLLLALQYVTAHVTVSIRCQEAGYVSGLVHQHNIRTPNNVTLRVESGDVADNSDLYRGQDVLVMPRRFGGLCLPANEALGHGMPVVMPAISPNNTWLPNDWLVPASLKTSFRAKQHVDVYETEPRILAAKIDQFATDSGFYQKSRLEAVELRTQYSWETLKPRYTETLEAL
jgi:glycosyltransferase involved in cell wall biosynthesis